MRTMSRVAGTGLSKVRSMARKRASAVGHGKRRHGEGTTWGGHRLAGRRFAAVRRLSHVKDLYRRML